MWRIRSSSVISGRYAIPQARLEQLRSVYAPRVAAEMRAQQEARRRYSISHPSSRSQRKQLVPAAVTHGHRCRSVVVVVVVTCLALVGLLAGAYCAAQYARPANARRGVVCGIDADELAAPPTKGMPAVLRALDVRQLTRKMMRVLRHGGAQPHALRSK